MPSILWAAFVLVVSLLPSNTFPEVNVLNFDKVVHCGIYFMLTFCVWFYFYKTENLTSSVSKKQQKSSFFLVCISCILFGFVIEILQQTLTTTRHFDLYDVAANSVGVLLFAAVRKIVEKRL
ncbi:MAG TPA: VanZ family protein [Chitinophagales bacterium]